MVTIATPTAAVVNDHMAATSTRATPTVTTTAGGDNLSCDLGLDEFCWVLPSTKLVLLRRVNLLGHGLLWDGGLGLLLQDVLEELRLLSIEVRIAGACCSEHGRQRNEEESRGLHCLVSSAYPPC